MKESLGQSQLPENFGTGEPCVRGEIKHHGFQLTCDNCLRGRETLRPYEDRLEVPGGMEREQARQHIEQQADMYIQQGRADCETCDQFLGKLCIRVMWHAVVAFSGSPAMVSGPLRPSSVVSRQVWDRGLPKTTR